MVCAPPRTPLNFFQSGALDLTVTKLHGSALPSRRLANRSAAKCVRRKPANSRHSPPSPNGNVLRPMKHRLSDARKACLGRPFSHTGRSWGGATVACVVATLGYWKLAPLEAGHLAVLAFFLAFAVTVALLVVVIRRWLRPPRPVLENTFLDVTAGGISQETPTSRTSLLASPEIGRANLYWQGNNLVRVVLHADARDVEVHGLEDMAGFLDDLRRTFVRSNCTDVRTG